MTKVMTAQLAPLLVPNPDAVLIGTGPGLDRAPDNATSLELHRCSFVPMAGVTREAKAAQERLPDRISIGVLARLFPARVLDEVVEAAGVRQVRSGGCQHG
jgi:hypothetical protein